jgi:DNA primase
VPLPEDAVDISEYLNASKPVTKHLGEVVAYMQSRGLYLEDYKFHWSPSMGYRDRLIVPFYDEGNIVGWTARTIQADKKPKYLSEQQPGYVFNLDAQGTDKTFCILTEGPIDAIHIEGIALLGSEIKDQQALLINRLNREVVVLPDRDDAGRKLVEQAIDYGWGVSMPEWKLGIKDVNDAVLAYGKLYTLYSIVSAAETSPLKIRLRAKKWFG